MPANLTHKSRGKTATPKGEPLSHKPSRNGASHPSAVTARGDDTHHDHRGLIVGIIVVIVLLAIGIVPRVKQQIALKKTSTAAKQAIPVVELTKPVTAPATRRLFLPGTIEAVEQTAINARATGYVNKVFVDIGDTVHAGQVLATISAPDTDQQVAQARAQLAQSASAVSQAQASETASETTETQQEANVALAQVTVDREKYMFDNGAVAKQEYDQSVATYKVNADSLNTTKANVAAAKAAIAAAFATENSNKANLDRMIDLAAFENVTAPFSGVVTARNVDPGAYVAGGGSAGGTASTGGSVAGASTSGSAATGGSSGGSATATASGSLFSIGSMNRLRIYVNLPQDVASGVQVGQPALVTLTSLPGKEFDGIVAHTTVAMDPASRTLVAEVQIDNPGGVIRPGMFGDVQFTVATPSGILLIPDPALLTDPAGTQVITVGTDRKAHYQTVQVGQDNGQQIQILGGLDATQQIVASPTYSIAEGQRVRVVQSAKGGGKHRSAAHAAPG